jgi:D-glycero-D-manno-heptose 1,7-bisphosphate phosphatase
MELLNIEHVFLDRDGVLNSKPAPGQYVTRWEEFHLLPCVEDAIAKLNRSGRKVIVVTNQRGVALGLYSLENLAHMHRQLREQLAAHGAHLDAIYVCPHNDDECDCRKPLTGLFEQAFLNFPSANATNSVMLGDSLRDIQAGRSLGMRTVLVGDSALVADDMDRARNLADMSAVSFPDFVERLLQAKV